MAFESFLKVVGKNIVSARKSKSLKQREIAAGVDLSYRYYQSVEAGEANLTLSTLFRLAKFLGVPPSELLAN